MIRLLKGTHSIGVMHGRFGTGYDYSRKDGPEFLRWIILEYLLIPKLHCYHFESVTRLQPVSFNLLEVWDRQGMETSK